MGRGVEKWQTTATIVGIPAFFITILQLVKPVLPWHALVPALVIGIILLVQGCVPWRHLQWTDERLADVQRLIRVSNIALFCLSFVIAAAMLLTAFVWGQAPQWIEAGLQKAIHTDRITPIATVTHPKPLVDNEHPDLAVTELPPGTRSGNLGTSDKEMSLYPASAALAVAIGSSKKFSQYSSLGIVAQILFLFLLVLGERIAEVGVRVNPKEGDS